MKKDSLLLLGFIVEKKIMGNKQALKPFLATREIDYTVTQKLLVMATSKKAAEEQLEEFTEGSDWSPAASLQHSVVQLSDEMTQIENTCNVSIEKAPKNVRLDDSLARLALEEKALEMWALLQKIYRCHHMYSAALSELGMEVKQFVETEIGKQASAEAVLSELGIDDGSNAV